MTSRRMDLSPPGLFPVAGKDPELLILGSFPSRLSLEHAEYYGNPQNHFWRIMEALFGIGPSAPYPERIRQVVARRIALWDVVRSCSRPGSADARIKEPVFNDIPGFVAARPTVRLIGLNGRMAARSYARIGDAIRVPSVALPSSSPAYAAMRLEEKIRRWSVLVEK